MKRAGHGRGPLRLMSIYGAVLVGTMAGIYLVSQILRNSIGVIAPDLAAEIGLTAAEIGLLSSAFFVSFSLAQIPLGISIDRYGPKVCMLACTGILVAATLLFCVASTPAGLIAARFLMGLGSCCYLMAPLAFYARRFPPERFSTLAGLQIGIGTVGTMIATAPLAVSAAAIGWRATFLVVAVAIALAGLLVAAVVPGGQGEDESPGGRESVRESLAGILTAARTPFMARLFLMHLTSYSSFVLVVGLWGGPYLAHVYGHGLAERGELLFLAATGQTAGLFLAGPLERLTGGVKPPVLIGAGLTGGMLLVVAAFGTLPHAALVLWLVGFGLVSAYSPVLIGHGKALFPPEVLGRGMTLLNIGTMLGVFVSQAATGAVIGLFPVSSEGAYPLEAYRLAFAIQGILVLLAILAYRSVPEPRHTKSIVKSDA